LDRARYSSRLMRPSFPKESRLRFNIHHDKVAQIANIRANTSITTPPIANPRP
jgi:hypothetical protein